MPTFKGTKSTKSKEPKDPKDHKYAKYRLPTILEAVPEKPILPPYTELNPSMDLDEYPKILPNYTEVPSSFSLLLPPQLSALTTHKILQLPPSEILKTLSLSSGKNNNIIKITDTINIVFDIHTGTLKEITSILPDDTDIGNILSQFNIPIPEIIKWLNRNHIIIYSCKNIGTLLIIDSKEVIDEYPDCISCILFEKVNINDNFDIKVIVNLKYEDSYIKKSDLLDVIFTNMNNFWIIIKQGDDIHLINYYKSKKDVLLSKNSSDYSYSVFIIKDYTFICSMWSLYDISPEVVYVLAYDKDKNVFIQQYTTVIVIDDKQEKHSIELYSVDTRFHNCGKYLSFCANYNISIFSLLFEVENKEKHFYTGVMALTQPDANQKTKIKLDFSQKTILSKEISDIDAQLMIYNIMEKTEASIIKEEKIRSQKILYEKKKYMANKQLENDKKELERREKKAKDIADKLLEEEEHLTLKKNKIQLKKNKDKEKQKNEKLVLIQEKLEKEKLEQEKLEQEKLVQEKLEKEKLEQEKLEKEKLEHEKLVQEKLEQEKLEKEKLEQEKLEQEKLEKEKLVHKKVKQVEPYKKLILKTNKREVKIPVIDTIPLTSISNDISTHIDNDISNHIDNDKTHIDYHISNEIDFKTSTYTLYYIFIHYMTMINSNVANALVFAQSQEHYNDLLVINRFYVMYALDILIINHKDIIELKNFIDLQKDKNFTISAIYGSYLPILYSTILNEIGFLFNAFNKDIEIKPLDKLKDYDTLVVKLLDDYIETHTDN